MAQAASCRLRVQPAVQKQTPRTPQYRSGRLSRS